jgi:hypothetical protein
MPGIRRGSGVLSAPQSLLDLAPNPLLIQAL